MKESIDLRANILDIQHHFNLYKCLQNVNVKFTEFIQCIYVIYNLRYTYCLFTFLKKNEKYNLCKNISLFVKIYKKGVIIIKFYDISYIFSYIFIYESMIPKLALEFIVLKRQNKVNTQIYIQPKHWNKQVIQRFISKYTDINKA